jgi:dTDP-4-dehydrorhamnose 3,5-epimerase
MAALKQTSVSIVGVEFSPEKVITDERGAVLHMMKNNHRFMEQQFGEIYFSEINPGVTKGWKRHNKMTQRLCVPSGLIKFVMYDDREDSPSYRKVDLITVVFGMHFRIKQSRYLC